MDIPKSPQSSLALWKSAVATFTALQAAVPSAIMLLVTQKGNDPRGAISDPTQLPRQLTLLEDYFPGLKPKPDGGKSYARCHIRYNGEKESFWQDAKASLKSAKADIYESKLPEEPFVTEGVMIKNSYPCMNVDEWGPFLKKLMEELAESEGGRQSEVAVAFNDKPLMDGNKRDRSNKRDMRMRRAVYVESPRGSETRNAYLLNKVLKGEAVASRCRIPLRLVSKFNRYASVNVRKQVTKAHRQHCQLRSSITDVTIDNIDDIDTPLPAINNSTIQELCMEIKNPSKPQDPAILGIDGKGTWASGSGIRVSVATKHEAEVIPVAENLAAYLYKAHGDAILQYLHPSAQEDALDTVWDPDTNCPISWEEQQAHEAGADDTVPEWVQETLQEDGTTPGLGPEVNRPLRGGFVVDFDNLSHDTFGLGRQGTQQGSISGPQAATQHQQATAPPPSSFIVPTFHSAPGVDDDITMGESIVTDRVAAVETSIANMEGTVTSLATSIQTLLLQLQQNQQQPPPGNAAELPESLAPGA